ncbi:hypothetical protein AURDEDRAFT_126525 [Auricularia subglabra TFB-10046 SS5]|nr:hypothetical protein AURDEDRAFT_126525 [Auricularia subglabra TFB-10046 SS5]
MPVTQQEILASVKRRHLAIWRTHGNELLFKAMREGDFMFTVWNNVGRRVDMEYYTIGQLEAKCRDGRLSVDVVNIDPVDVPEAIERGLRGTMPTFDPEELRKCLEANLEEGSTAEDITRVIGDYLGPSELRTKTPGGVPGAQSAEKPSVQLSHDSAGGYDSLGRELDDNARIWKVFRKEVTAFDQNVTLDEWNKTMDILLVFAGLFSAVVTSFVVQFAGLQPVTDDPSAQSMMAAVRVLILSLNNTAGPEILQVSGQVEPQPRHLLVAIRLWFTSLFIALIVALLCILAKQWLFDYNRRMSVEAATTRQWARRRWIYMHGFEKWPVDGFITQFLPLLLHVAVLLFIVGLNILLWPFDRDLAVAMTSLTVITFTFYLVCTLMPLWKVDFPTSTPLVRQLRTACLFSFFAVLRAVESLKRYLFRSDVLPDPEQKPFNRHVFQALTTLSRSPSVPSAHFH